MDRFDQTYSYKLIYVFSMPYETHNGLLKVGEATLTTNIKPDSLVPNCRELNQAALARIKGYTATASVNFTLLHTELALKIESGYSFPFKDKDVHKVLMNSGVHKVQPNGSTGEEWFETTIEIVKAAIKAVKEGKNSLSANEQHQTSEPVVKIDFREEQIDAIEKTIKTFAKSDEMLWYAKMRFGKTLTALEVVRRLQYRKVIIVTHRPVVSDGWGTDFKKIFYPGSSEHDYSFECKTTDSAYVFDEKTDSENDLKIRKLDADGSYFIYFASIQDLRGSQLVGGNFNKNNAVFGLDWDLVIIDEAHEGTQTELGGNVVKLLRKKGTKLLALSGTPFNLLSQYDEENVYTWDYVMEQRKKDEWDILHQGDHNPYAELPKMHIYTYDLGEKLKQFVTDEYDTKAFNFREFFRVWSKGPNGKRELPSHAIEGRFVHENDVISFLNLLVKDDADSIYPFSTPEYRDMFRHTLWMVPGVKEAKALSELLRSHPVFGNGNFGIANVAGEGDRYEEEHSADALELVRNTIKNNKYSITLSCGKLTTGVTVKEWTAVLMLSGSYSTAAAQYMQTIFRVQSAGSIDGRQKTDCYVFDFAPDRTLKVLTETVHLSRKPGKSDQKRREAMTEFLNYCPVIAIAGSHMTYYSVNSMMEQIKQIYAERAVNSGFEDESIYNDELLRLDELDASMFNQLRDIVGSSKASKKKSEVIVTNNGLTDEQIENIDDPDIPDVSDKPPLTPEQIAERLAKKQARETRKKAIDILRAISIRMPLMIFGADVPIDEDIDIDRFIDLIDDKSWEEFMPQGVTKPMFSKFTKYYDRDVFIAAGKRIRRLAAAADKETPTRRVQQIAEIFRHFKNPDKETVLTPWRVVNMHMSDTIGGWCFFNEDFEDDTSENKRRLEEPRFVNRGEVTQQVFGENAKILEINSKTGLYPLYVAYSVYRQKLEGMHDDDWEPEELAVFWEETLKESIFVICKTPMAKSITIRTLRGFSNVYVNAHYFEDLVNMLRNKPEQFKKRILKGSYWKKEVNKMQFDAIVGNPPYQENIGGTGNDSLSRQLFPDFVRESILLDTKYVSLIMPARWFTADAQDKSFVKLRDFIMENNHIAKMYHYKDEKDIFRDVEIKGGVCYFLYDKEHNGTVEFAVVSNGVKDVKDRLLFEPNMDVIISDTMGLRILDKVRDKSANYMTEITTGRNPFGIIGKESVVAELSKPEHFENACELRCKGGVVRWVDDESITKNRDIFEKYKVFISKSAGNPNSDFKVIGIPYIGKPNSACTDSLIAVGCFDTLFEAQSLQKYMMTKFLRYMVSIVKASQNVTQIVYQFVPIQDFTISSDINWSETVENIDEQLYKKYELSEEEINFIESTIKPVNSVSKEISTLLKKSYPEIVDYLLKKYGIAKHDYFKDTACTQKNSLISRTSDGLYCHHIDEDKAIMLSNDEHAAANPFDYQKADRLVYCNLLEHLILHVKIAAEPISAEANENQLPGIGGAVNFICKELNDIYAGKEFTDEWRKKVASIVKDSFDDYIMVLKYLLEVIEKNPIYKAAITTESLCVGYDGKVVRSVLNTLLGNDD